MLATRRLEICTRQYFVHVSRSSTGTSFASRFLCRHIRQVPSALGVPNVALPLWPHQGLVAAKDAWQDLVPSSAWQGSVAQSKVPTVRILRSPNHFDLFLSLSLPPPALSQCRQLASRTRKPIASSYPASLDGSGVSHLRVGECAAISGHALRDKRDDEPAN
ncbi:uncharacterized protein LY79DRAFT_74970 [Colletotrichum navitas]|uniref:Uncharacterized protein n=1 Tax=Colletotrichum navitas TaxID=681940 RepID=A0AAD8Q670_9PEZI|nr:uncharacterized protein LY79DRAFT_74970 [Colletotrichum navitas]KAK1596006.1 hypothetical protein LY79DRAFT_74970 [Colletotrichum navitas]